MTIKTQVITLFVTFGVGAAIGNYFAVKPSTSLIETTKTDTQKDVKTHKETKITKDPKGNEITTIVEDTDSNTNRTKDSNINKTVTQPRNNILNVSALAGNDFKDVFKPIYGVSVNKEFIGPITLGVFGMTNSVIGLSVGVNF